MSYEIVKKLKMKDGKVYMKYASNNVRPLYWYEGEISSLTKILQEKGQKALDIEILQEYEGGMFQAGTPNKYSKAIKRLRRMLEYKVFDWRNTGEAYKIACEKRETPEFNELLYKAFTAKEKITPYIVSKIHNTKMAYIKRVGKWRITFTYYKEKAKKFNYKDEAERVINSLQADSLNFTITQL